MAHDHRRQNGHSFSPTNSTKRIPQICATSNPWIQMGENRTENKMNITPEQIDAALRYESDLDTKSDSRLLAGIAKDRHGCPLPYDGAIILLAAAYRAKCEECEELYDKIEELHMIEEEIRERAEL